MSSGSHLPQVLTSHCPPPAIEQPYDRTTLLHHPQSHIQSSISTNHHQLPRTSRLCYSLPLLLLRIRTYHPSSHRHSNHPIHPSICPHPSIRFAPPLLYPAVIPARRSLPGLPRRARPGGRRSPEGTHVGTLPASRHVRFVSAPPIPVPDVWTSSVRRGVVRLLFAPSPPFSHGSPT